MAWSLNHPPGDESPIAREAWSLYLPATLLFLVSVAATLHFIRTMSCNMAMSRGGTMSMIWMRSPGRSWPESAAEFLLMWLAMMVAMMLPSVLPMLSRFQPGGRAARVAGGYFTVWLGAGVLVYGAGILWSSAVTRWSGLAGAGPALAGAMLVLAGALQLTPWKRAGLGRCRERGRCAVTETGGGDFPGFREGIRQGLACAVGSAGPMLALLAVGMMNPYFMTAIAVLIGFEKLARRPGAVILGSAALFFVVGVTVILRALP